MLQVHGRAWACVDIGISGQSRCHNPAMHSAPGGELPGFAAPILLQYAPLGRSPSSEDLCSLSRRSSEDDSSYKAAAATVGLFLESVDIRRGSRQTFIAPVKPNGATAASGTLDQGYRGIGHLLSGRAAPVHGQACQEKNNNT